MKEQTNRLQFCRRKGKCRADPAGSREGRLCFLPPPSQPQVLPAGPAPPCRSRITALPPPPPPWLSTSVRCFCTTFLACAPSPFLLPLVGKQACPPPWLPEHTTLGSITRPLITSSWASSNWEVFLPFPAPTTSALLFLSPPLKYGSLPTALP